MSSNIIAMYPNSSIFVALGKLGIVLMVLFSYPLQVHPCRASLEKVIGTIWKQKTFPVQAQREDEDDPVVAPNAEVGNVRFVCLVSLTSLRSTDLKSNR